MYVTSVLHVSLPTKRPQPGILPLFQRPVQQSTVQYLPFQVPFLSLGSLNLNLSLASPNEEAPRHTKKKKKKNENEEESRSETKKRQKKKKKGKEKKACTAFKHT